MLDEDEEGGAEMKLCISAIKAGVGVIDLNFEVQIQVDRCNISLEPLSKAQFSTRLCTKQRHYHTSRKLLRMRRLAQRDLLCQSAGNTNVKIIVALLTMTSYLRLSNSSHDQTLPGTFSPGILTQERKRVLTYL